MATPDPAARLRVAVVIPALDEERALPLVLADIPGALVERVVVVDNGSADRTAAVAREGGAEVVTEPRRGYGRACLAGIAHLAGRPDGPPDVVAFLDADHSDHPDELGRLLLPIERGEAELVIGSRVLGRRERGALPPQALLGNALACALMRGLYGVRHTDLGPFRAVTWAALRRIGMADTGYGWTVEMQVKAARLRVATAEAPVSYRRRVGVSKVSGTVRGVVGAGTKILWTIFRHAGRRAAGGRGDEVAGSKRT